MSESVPEPVPERQFAAVQGTRFAPVRWVAETGSTNTDLLQLAAAGAAEGHVLITDVQHTGRGRRNRRWSAPVGSALLMSVLVRPPRSALGPDRISLVTTALALSAIDACESVSGVRPQLKWPNDLVVQSVGREQCGSGDGTRKLAGVLAESLSSGAADAGSLAGPGSPTHQGSSGGPGSPTHGRSSIGPGSPTHQGSSAGPGSPTHQGSSGGLGSPTDGQTSGGPGSPTHQGSSGGPGSSTDSASPTDRRSPVDPGPSADPDPERRSQHATSHLAPTAGAASGIAVVVGIGMNLNWPALPPELAQTAASLNLVAGRGIDRCEVAYELLRGFEDRYSRLCEPGGPAALSSQARRNSATLGRLVRVELGAARSARERRAEAAAEARIGTGDAADDGLDLAEPGPSDAEAGIGTGDAADGCTPLEGTATGLLDDGRLEVTDAHGCRHVVAAGDVVHLRPAAP